jgi:hypothetical protein
MPLTQVQGAMVGPTGFANLSGITFPATQVPSADANTLDDYEEGTWTPFMQANGSPATGVTYTTQAGTYVKIGQFVYVQLMLSWTNKGTASGVWQIGGLPFATPSAGVNAAARAACGACGNTYGSAQVNGVYGEYASSYLLPTNGSNPNEINYTSAPSGATLFISAGYRTTA